MFKLKSEVQFDTAHYLSGYEGKCSNIHGHRYRLIATIGSKELHKDGLIKQDAHRHYRHKRTINYGKVPCYGIVMEDWLGRDALLKAESQKKRIIKKPKNLLEDDEDEEVAKEVVNGESDLQNLPQQSEIENGEELKSA